MAWLSILFEIPATAAETVADALIEAGALSVDVTDADAGSPAEQPVFDEPGTARQGVWRRARCAVLVQTGADAAALVATACGEAGISPPPYHVERVAEQDWVRASRDQFKPIRISGRLWVVPSWHEPPDPAAINLLLDPGLAFGTGSHPTTRLCLQWLEREIRGGETVLDYGCGSGVLAIAAMKLGAARADGVDIDEQALLAARANAQHNQTQVFFHDAADAIRQPAQIVVANILAHPLIVLAPLLSRLTAPGGRLALAGLLEPQAGEVTAAYQRWFDLDAPTEQEGWILVTGTRRAA